MNNLDREYLFVLAIRTINDGFRLLEWIECEGEKNTESIRSCLQVFENRISSNERMRKMGNASNGAF